MNAETLRLHEHLKKESPLNRTVMITHANGSCGYRPDDAAFDRLGYEITISRMRRERDPQSFLCS